MTRANKRTGTLPAARAYAVVSVIAALVTLALKFGAYALTDSIGLLSDALESVINLVAASIAVWALTVASRPPDAEHAYGHSKAEYFASGTESLLILLAAAGIAAAAWDRLLHPRPLERIELGLAISLSASAVNGAVAVILFRAGRRLRSITLRADASHLVTDVWTSVGVVLGLFFAQATGWYVLDPILAFVVAANILWTGLRLLRDTASGVLDTALPAADQERIDAVLAGFRHEGTQFHALRTRAAGPRRFVSMHVLVPGSWSVQRGHDLCEEIERNIVEALPTSTVFTHLEPLEDHASWEDQSLDRAAPPLPTSSTDR